MPSEILSQEDFNRLVDLYTYDPRNAKQPRFKFEYEAPPQPSVQLTFEFESDFSDCPTTFEEFEKWFDNLSDKDKDEFEYAHGPCRLSSSPAIDKLLDFICGLHPKAPC